MMLMAGVSVGAQAAPLADASKSQSGNLGMLSQRGGGGGGGGGGGDGVGTGKSEGNLWNFSPEALIPRDFGVWVCECTCARVWGGVCGGVGVPVRACVGHAHVRLHRTSAHP